MPRQPTLVGNTVLLVIDIQASAFMDTKMGIPVMPGYRENMERALKVIAAARAVDMPTVFVQEIHRRDNIDYGRELDGAEGIHCREDHPGTALPAEITGQRPEDYFVPKRRYSAFFGTDLEILLKGLKAQTLILIGGMTDVCVHYTFVDGHQHDYFCRVVGDSVGGTSPQAHEASLAAMEYLQTGAVIDTEAVIAQIHALQEAA
ncbi:cysteine hydrolase family protein [Pseudooceanicola algae]|uniref:Peroxyureidoacrylate/ureidoacrylate amidohydrolase RutB n=1 Tax=Pseudooceanicola algae TaxID=1537215 RepID=A0A418SG79_9RHOB|nr:cysteine hydrolase [Pseudooceanicola algae]QPM91674.1 Peroxyureidoacrylate/ureidoacrylate amidohydrolase RutB [Pseudooceanicola algae]